MAIAQRGTSTSSVTTTGYYTCDRFLNLITSMGTYTISQESDGPAGFGKSFKTLVTTADATPAASSRTVLIQRQEGLALQRLAFGTASAKTTTMSFYVKSNVTGTYIFELATTTGRSINASYTINAADTWEKKTITFAGDTNTAITADNGLGSAVVWWLGAGTDFTSGTLATSWATTVNANRAVGQVNFAAATNNYFQITGVQWEIGNVATDFQLSAGTIQGELAVCQRYYYVHSRNENWANGQASSTSGVTAPILLPIEMRVAPTITLAPAGASSGNINFLNSSLNFPSTTGTISASSITKHGFQIVGSGFTSSFTAGNSSLVYSNGTNNVYTASSEL